MAPSETFEDLLRDAERATQGLREMWRQKDYGALAEAARQLLSNASRLHTRARVMEDIQREGLAGL
jgi:hypothetical protein